MQKCIWLLTPLRSTEIAIYLFFLFRLLWLFLTQLQSFLISTQLQSFLIPTLSSKFSGHFSHNFRVFRSPHYLQNFLVISHTTSEFSDPHTTSEFSDPHTTSEFSDPHNFQSFQIPTQLQSFLTPTLPSKISGQSSRSFRSFLILPHPSQFSKIADNV